MKREDIIEGLYGIFRFCMGPIGGTALYAAMTGALFARFEWLGLVMAGLVGLLVSAGMTQAEEGGYGGHGMGLPVFKMHLRVLEARRRESKEERLARIAAAHERRESFSFANTASVCMIIAGIGMFAIENL